MSHGNQDDPRLLAPVTAFKCITKVRLINSKQTPGRRGNDPSSKSLLPALLSALRQHLNSTAAGKMGKTVVWVLLALQKPAVLMRGGDNDGATPSPYRD